jgi:hypothetical protein
MDDHEKLRPDMPNISRRGALKKLGIAGVTLTALPGVVAADSGPAQTIRPNTSDYDALDEVEVTLTKDANVRVDMSGTVDADVHQAKGYRVKLTDVQTDYGQLTPQQADVTLVRLPRSKLPGQRNDRQGVSSNSDSGSGTASVNGSIGTLNHGGTDNERDEEGGAWARTLDLVGITVTRTDHRIKWTTSNGEVDWANWRWNAEWNTISSPPTPPSPGKNASIWKPDDYGHDYTTWLGDTVQSDAYGDYYNWTWSYDRNKTTTHHRILLIGRPDGSLHWETNHWNNGEDAGALLIDAGIHGNY